MKILTLLVLSLALAAPAHSLSPGHSGSWYDPAHPGHGLSVEVLTPTRAIAYWLVYDPAGEPVHLYIEGSTVDRTLRGTAYLARGMRFGRFDPRDNAVTRWGTIEIEWASCDEATLRYDADGPAGAGYGRGAVPLARLAAIDGLGCL